MKVAVLGTGMVGQAHAFKLIELGHEVVIGTKDVEVTKAADWYKDNQFVKLLPFGEAANEGEIVLNALAGHIAVEVLKGIEASLQGKILIDISNPLDFSKGMPPTLSVCNTDSLGEQIQQALPETKVVKALNTINATIQVEPQSLADGDHHCFMSGNDDLAKTQVAELLRSYGWKHILDLGDIATARGTEMYLPLWLRIWGSLSNAAFNVKVMQN